MGALERGLSSAGSIIWCANVTTISCPFWKNFAKRANFAERRQHHGQYLLHPIPFRRAGRGNPEYRKSLPEGFSLHSYDEADEDTKRFVDREFYEQHLNNIIELLYPGCEYGWRGAIRGKITEESYQSLGDGQLVLSFEAESSYMPVNSLWNDALSQWAPNSRYYYYAEEMRLEGIWTNDVFRKYFPWTTFSSPKLKKIFLKASLTS